MKILVTGANGFIGKNLCARLECTTDHEILKATRETTHEQLREYVKECDFIYHLAGVNRPEDNDFSVNINYTATLCRLMEDAKNFVPVVFSSSVHASKKDHQYGLSKALAESILTDFSKEYNTPVYIYRLSNVFGKWCKPNYNSVVATFCHNIARNQKITIVKDSKLDLMYIDDVVSEFIRMLDSNVFEQNKIPSHSTTVKALAKRIMTCAEIQQSLYVNVMNNLLDKNLYATYLSYVPFCDLVGGTRVFRDERGSFAELIKGSGQVSVNIVNPCHEKGGHWHDTKTERFYIVHGNATIKIDDKKMMVAEGNYIDIPCGTVHSIINEQNEDLVVIIWCNEFFDKERPDTMTWRA